MGANRPPGGPSRAFLSSSYGLKSEVSLIQLAGTPDLIRSVEHFRSGDALFTCNEKLEVGAWNRAAEQLTGIPATEAIGRRCWHVLCGVSDSGQTICHAGCSNARLARDGWPLACQHLLIKTPNGRRRVAISTIATDIS